MKYLVFVAYYVYCLGIMAGCGYIVFWRGESGWWFVLAALMTEISPEFKSKG